MAVREQQVREAQRTLRELLPITAAAMAAAVGVAVLVSPAMSYLDRSVSGLVNDIPDAVSAPVARGARLLAPDDITVRVRPRTGAGQVALAAPGASPLELVTGQLGAALIRQDALGSDIARATVVAVPEVAAPVPFEITPSAAPLAPIAVATPEAIPAEGADVLDSGAGKRNIPSKEVRVPRDGPERSRSTDGATFSIAGIQPVEDSPEADKHRQKNGEKHPPVSEGKDNGHRADAGAGSGEPMKRNSKPEKR